MPNNHSTFKRSELAQCYFPDLKPMSAWEKFKDWLDTSARLRPLLSLTRRTYRYLVSGYSIVATVSLLDEIVKPMRRVSVVFLMLTKLPLGLEAAGMVLLSK